MTLSPQKKIIDQLPRYKKLLFKVIEHREKMLVDLSTSLQYKQIPINPINLKFKKRLADDLVALKALYDKEESCETDIYVPIVRPSYFDK